MAEVKICGLSEPETLTTALDHGAAMVGFVFFPKSPRNVNLEQAKSLAALSRGRARNVVLVVDAGDALLAEIARDVRPDYFQAHGDETPARIAEIRSNTGIPVIKAVRVRTADHVAAAARFDEVAELVLFDAIPPEGGPLPGGNGLAFDWTILSGYPRRFMLAGGLTPSNVATAVRMTQAPIVDVSSGVESAPGIKDKVAIVKFIEAARAAS